MLPNDFPPWKTVYDHFSRWNRRGVWAAALDPLTQLHRQKEGREPTNYAVIDSQSVKNQYASEQRGIDGNKKMKSCKRHLIVDILGNLLAVHVHAANLGRYPGRWSGFGSRRAALSPLQAFSGDAGYRGTAVTFVSEKLRLTLHIAPNQPLKKVNFR